MLNFKEDNTAFLIFLITIWQRDMDSRLVSLFLLVLAAGEASPLVSNTDLDFINLIVFRN